jgi:hypothetical protein
MRKKFEILNDPKKKIILELPKFGGKIGATTFSITTLSMSVHSVLTTLMLITY